VSVDAWSSFIAVGIGADGSKTAGFKAVAVGCWLDLFGYGICSARNLADISRLVLWPSDFTCSA
jgi:hypothetical protein